MNDPGIQPVSPTAGGLQVDSLPLSHQGSPYVEYVCEMLGWMNHKLESRLLGDMQMIPL